MHKSSRPTKTIKSSAKLRKPAGLHAAAASDDNMKTTKPTSSHSNILTISSRLFAARKKAVPEPPAATKTKTAKMAKVGKEAPPPVEKKTKVKATKKDSTTTSTTTTPATPPIPISPTKPTTRSKKTTLDSVSLHPADNETKTASKGKKATKQLAAATTLSPEINEMIDQSALDRIGLKIAQSLANQHHHTAPQNIDISTIKFNEEELEAIMPSHEDFQIGLNAAAADDEGKKDEGKKDEKKMGNDEKQGNSAHIQPKLTPRELHYQSLQQRAMKKKQNLDLRQQEAIALLETNNDDGKGGQLDANGRKLRQKQRGDDGDDDNDHGLVDYQEHYQEAPTEIDLDGAFEELNRYLHSNGTSQQKEQYTTHPNPNRSRQRKGLGIQSYDPDGDESSADLTESDPFYSETETMSEEHSGSADDDHDESGSDGLKNKHKKRRKQQLAPINEMHSDMNSEEQSRPDDSDDSSFLEVSGDGDSEEEHLERLIMEEQNEHDEDSDTSEFTTSETIHLDSSQSSSNRQLDGNNPDAAANGGSGQQHPRHHHSPASSASGHHNRGDDHNNDSNNPNNSGPFNNSASDSFGAGNQDRGAGGNGRKEKNWPRFNQDIYNRLYAPNASISPKLSSCLVLPLQHNMRPLFPGLYCPVTVRDPAIVTEILKQTYKGFPYVGVFLKKSKTKSDIFNQTDSKLAPSSPIQADGTANSKTTQTGMDDGALDVGDIEPDNLHTVGTFAHIFNITHLNGGAIHMLLVGLRRIELDSVKYGLVPNLGPRGVNALISSTMPGQGGNAGGSGPKMGQYGNNPQSFNEDIEGSSGQRNKRRAAAAAAAATAASSIGATGANNRDVDSPVNSQELSPQEILEQVMNFDTSKHHELTNPANPLPKTLKRVLIGNITHHDETSVHTATTNEDGSLKTPLELSRQEEIYKVYTVEILSAAKELLQQSSPGILEQLQYLHSSFDFSNPVFVADFISNLTNASSEQMQQLLSTLDVTKRMHLTLLMIKREVEMTRFHTNIQNSVEESLKKTQREFYLKQQLSQIKKELGMEKGDDKQTLANKFKLRVKDRWDFIPQYAKTVIEDELSKLETLDSSSSEYNVTRNYIDWLTVLPWEHSTDEIYDIQRTEATLNEDHYGMQDVKDRILEFVAVGKLLQKQKEAKMKKKAEEEQIQKDQAQKDHLDKNGSNDESLSTSLNLSSPPEFMIPIKKDKKGKVDQDEDENGKDGEGVSKTSLFSADQFTPKESKEKHQASTGKIMLFVGPPGIGKTSIGKSIAKSLNREFYRFSVGGLTDVSEIKGHRRTYVGALPGKIVQALKKTQCSNPVVLIDEIDKIGRGGNHGDPSSALLEVLDPEQNATFTDHYMDISIDLSKVLFICTANKLHDISGPLRDRMDVVELSGYIQQEKEHIAKHYLEPHLLTRCGLERHEAEIDPATISHLVKWYCREAGVRTLQKYLEMILRKVAFRVVRNDPLPIRVTVENLSEYIGQELYQSDRMYDRTPVGVVAGLAWSAAGGSTMYIESAVSRTLFNRKMWGLPPLNKNKNSNDVNDSVSITETHGSNQIHTTVDVATNDTQIIIETNDKASRPSAVDGLAPSHPSLRKKKKNKKNKSKKSNNQNTDNGVDDNDGSDEDGGSDYEESDTQGTGSLKLTGSLGEVMKESASIAYTLAKHYLHKMAADFESQRAVMIADRFGAQHAHEDFSSMSIEHQNVINEELNLITQDAPIDPVNCKIPILRPPISNTTSTASKVANTHLNHKQSQLQTEMETKMKELRTLQQEFEKLSQLTSNEDELFTTEVQPIIHNNPQRNLKPGDIYSTPSTASIKHQFIPVHEPSFFNTAHIHIHAPQGATPKDGPSAGIALVSVLMSQALQRPLVNNIAMTGEVSLTGKVLPIGGLREKIIGARQSNIYHLIVPKANMHDIADLPSFITSGLTIYFAETCDEVLRIVFGSPYSLGGKDAKPTLIKKYETFDGDAELEILKMQSQEAIEALAKKKQADLENNTNNNNNNGTPTDENNSTAIPLTTITDAEIVPPVAPVSAYPAPGSHQFMKFGV